jgi:hypothetical protein
LRYNETIKLQLKKGAGDWQDCNQAAVCGNVTPTNCTHCINVTYRWYVNFSSASDAATWFYRFLMNNSNTNLNDKETSGTDTLNVLATDVKIFLENATENPPTGSWGGGNFTFNVTVNTTGANNVTVFLWTGKGPSGPWTLIEQQNYTIPSGGWQKFNFSKKYDCGDAGDNYYFFNATNYNATTNMSSISSFKVN